MGDVNMLYQRFEIIIFLGKLPYIQNIRHICALTAQSGTCKCYLGQTWPRCHKLALTWFSESIVRAR